MKLWPSRNSTVVEASRRISAGTVTPPVIDTPWAGSSWLTFGLMMRLIWPSLSTVGVKDRPTPYFLYSIAVWPSEPGTGIGYSPPARKLAVSPDSAVRLGCARLRTRPFCSSALSSTSIGNWPPPRRPIRKPNGDAPDSTPAATTGDMVAAEGGTLRPPIPAPDSAVCWNEPFGAVIGNCEAGTLLPTLARTRLPNTFH